MVVRTHVKDAEKFSDEKLVYEPIYKMFMNRMQEIFNVVSVVYGKFRTQSINNTFKFKSIVAF